MDAGAPERERFDGVGVDSKLKQRLSDMADEIGAKNTRVAIAVPVRQIIGIFHEVYGDVPHVPDYDPDRDDRQRWGGLAAYSPSEVPDAQNEVGLRLADDAVIVDMEGFTGGGWEDCAVLNLEQAKDYFLTGLALVAEGERQAAERPVMGVTDEQAAAELLAGQGIVSVTVTRAGADAAGQD
ncbi:MAG TPA: hypothetical protein VE476_01050 [Propionibacteriaceae bacterium]|nr:hypothetical protein [Propionibacteriaceae bacterium]